MQRAVDTGVNGVVMEIPSSKHMLELAYRWPLEKAIETSVEATAFAHKNGLEVVFLPVDFSRAELKWAIDMIERVGKEGHMDAPSLKLRRGKPAFAKASARQARWPWSTPSACCRRTP